MLAVERSHLSIEAMVASPMSPAFPCWPMTKAISAPPWSIWAQATTIAVFAGGRFVHSEGFALGGHNVTLDMARGLNASVADAERIKTFTAACWSAARTSAT
jgi:cell division protein FtsA